MVSSGWIVSIIATIHVFASHTSVSTAELLCAPQNQPELLDYIKKYGVFLRVFTYVVGYHLARHLIFHDAIKSAPPLSSHSRVYMEMGCRVDVLRYYAVGIYITVYLVGTIAQRTQLRIALIFDLASYTTILIIGIFPS